MVAEWATQFGRASTLIVTGDSWASTLHMARTVGAVLPDRALALGGGVTHVNVREAFDVADALIVGSALEEESFTGPLWEAKARALAETAGLA
jgi:predicted TIM-barrel enzyme